jgi:SPP1 family predicted phage head-tail adaptor
VPSFPYGQTVTLIRRTVTSRDERGNDVYSESPEAIPQAVVQPTGSTEFTQFTDQVSTDMTVFLPYGTKVSAIDAIEIAGQRYEIQGEPSSWRSPFSGNTSPVQLRLSRITGVSV